MRSIILIFLLAVAVALPAAAMLERDVPPHNTAPAPAWSWSVPDLSAAFDFEFEANWPASMRGLAWTFDAVAR